MGKITYKCKDAAGNAADALTRTVVVKDTTCPTCTITGLQSVKREASFPYSDLGAICTDNIDGNLGAASVAGNNGVNGQFNPAHGAAGNPYFMSESQTSVNGWVIGAVASAVSGVALLGFSMRKTTVAPPVPV